MNKNANNSNSNNSNATAWDVPVIYASPIEALRAGINNADSLKDYSVEVYRGTMNTVEVFTGATRPRLVVVTINTNELA